MSGEPTFTDADAPQEPAQFGDTLDLVLAEPIKVGQAEYMELRLVEPTAGQLIQADKAGSPLEVLAKLVQLVACVPMAAVVQLKQRDFQACDRFFGHFGSESRRSPGPKLSP